MNKQQGQEAVVVLSLPTERGIICRSMMMVMVIDDDDGDDDDDDDGGDDGDDQVGREGRTTLGRGGKEFKARQLTSVPSEKDSQLNNS